MVMKMQEELDSLNDLVPPDLASGIDFYEEVKQFESELIKRALILMGGHQGKAARLLNMNSTTLNAKMKHYRIRLGQHDAGG